MTPVKPALYSVNDAKLRLGVKHTKFYDLLHEGNLVAVKLGARTMITAQSLETFISSLPPLKLQHGIARAA